MNLKLAGLLSEAGINYAHPGEELGGYRRGGYLNFVVTSEFQTGLKKLEEIAQDKGADIIWAGWFHWCCHHRFIAQELKKHG